MFPGPAELLLIGFLIESIGTPKSKSSTLTPKKQLADILTKGNFTRDEWNHLLCLFNISHFSSAECSEVMSKRTQRDSGEERVTAKSKRMMNLVSRCSERTPFLWARKLSSIIERWDPLKTHTHQATQNGILIKLGLLKSGNLMNWWTIERGDLLFAYSTRTDSLLETMRQILTPKQKQKLSLGSRSFLHKVNDQVRKGHKQSSNDATQDSDKHSVIWRMFMSSTLQASVFMGKNYLEILHSIKNTEDLTVKPMFDISEKLITEQDEIYGTSKN